MGVRSKRDCRGQRIRQPGQRDFNERFVLTGKLQIVSYFNFLYFAYFNSTKFLTVFSEQQLVQEQVIDLLPMVSEANAISEELNKYCQFEVVLISAAAQAGGFGERSTK